MKGRHCYLISTLHQVQMVVMEEGLRLTRFTDLQAGPVYILNRSITVRTEKFAPSQLITALKDVNMAVVWPNTINCHSRIDRFVIRHMDGFPQAFTLRTHGTPVSPDRTFTACAMSVPMSSWHNCLSGENNCNRCIPVQCSAIQCNPMQRCDDERNEEANVDFLQVFGYIPSDRVQ